MNYYRIDILLDYLNLWLFLFIPQHTSIGGIRPSPAPSSGKAYVGGGGGTSAAAAAATNSGGWSYTT